MGEYWEAASSLPVISDRSGLRLAKCVIVDSGQILEQERSKLEIEVSFSFIGRNYQSCEVRERLFGKHALMF